jgi:hypothetical protein
LWLLEVRDPGVPIQQANFSKLVQDRRGRRGNVIAAYGHTQYWRCTGFCLGQARRVASREFR